MGRASEIKKKYTTCTSEFSRRFINMENVTYYGGQNNRVKACKTKNMSRITTICTTVLCIGIY